MASAGEWSSPAAAAPPNANASGTVRLLTTRPSTRRRAAVDLGLSAAARLNPRSAASQRRAFSSSRAIRTCAVKACGSSARACSNAARASPTRPSCS